MLAVFWLLSICLAFYIGGKTGESNGRALIVHKMLESRGALESYEAIVGKVGYTNEDQAHWAGFLKGWEARMLARKDAR